MYFDFTTVDYTPTHGIFFRIPTVEQNESTIAIRAFLDLYDDGGCRLTVWGSPTYARVQLLIVKIDLEVPEMPLEDMATSVVGFLMESPEFIAAVYEFAKTAKIQPFTIDEDAEIPISIVPAFRFSYPEKIAPDFLPEKWKDELILEVEFGIDVERNYFYNLFAYIDSLDSRVWIHSEKAPLSCDSDSDEYADMDPNDIVDNIDLQAVAMSILERLSELTAENHDTILSRKRLLLEGSKTKLPANIKVFGSGKDTVVISPNGLSEEETTVVQALQSYLDSPADPDEE